MKDLWVAGSSTMDEEDLDNQLKLNEVLNEAFDDLMKNMKQFAELKLSYQFKTGKVVARVELRIKGYENNFNIEEAVKKYKTTN
jgi:hypothetical protein